MITEYLVRILENTYVSQVEKTHSSVPPKPSILFSLAAHNNKHSAKFVLIHAKESSDIYKKIEPLLQAGQTVTLNLIVETGLRKNSSIHYFPIYFKFRENNSCQMFVLDHANGYDTSLNSFSALAREKGYKIDKFIAGGKKMQSDFYSCFFFTYHTLLKLQSIPLEQITQYASSDGHIDWKNLPPMLVAPTQSMKDIWDYVDCKATFFHQHNSYPQSAPVPELLESDADGSNFETVISKGVEVIQEGKIINSSIKTIASELAKNALSFLHESQNSPHIIIESAFPKEVYPHINKLLTQLDEKISAINSDGIPLIAEIYNNPEHWEQYLANDIFYNTFSDINLLCLCQAKMLDFKDLIKCCTDGDKINLDIIKNVDRRIKSSAMTFLNELIAKNIPITKADCLEFLTSNSCQLLELSKPLILAKQLTFSEYVILSNTKITTESFKELDELKSTPDKLADELKKIITVDVKNVANVAAEVQGDDLSFLLYP